MGILGTDYTLRSGQVIFLLLVASSVILGFSYLNEMYQRIQLQENMGRQTQHIVAERSTIQRKASLLQVQIENRDKEIKRLQDMHEFQTDQQNSICETEKSNLLETILSKDETITEVQTQYESMKQTFEHLRSVMEQFEKNQSRLLEKFSTQSTQCMTVINMMSELCNKSNVIKKIAKVTKQNETAAIGTTTQSNNSVNATVRYLLVSQPPQNMNKTNGKNNKEFSSKSSLTNVTILDSDNDKQSSLKAMQGLEELVSELNKTNNTKDIKDEIMKLEKIQNSTKENVFKSQTKEGGNYDETSIEKGLPELILINETVIGQKQTTEQQIRRNEILPDLKEDLESEKLDHTKYEGVDNSHYSMLLSKDESVQPTNQNSRTSNGAIFIKEQLTDEPLEKTLAEDYPENEDNAYITEKYIHVQKNPRRLTLQKVKTPVGVVYKTIGDSEYEDNTEDVEKGLELSDQDILNITT
ncbi:uncharacterized protein LOC142748064 [Rhinoderma darwinii]|uniref:uncharacterized protein LOC142748064 n=1 Tax=Rhinoderma darwinii TaxID=43563 RepID=UPI003F660C61